jgi:aspartyl-tRNA(Asn)/glutamyl-tRNA(Gln) amidotransferase subunit B
VVATGVNPKIACNWVTVELRGRLNADGTGLHESPVSAADLGEILGRIAEGKLSGKLAKKVFTRVYDGESVQEVLAQIGEQVTDPKAIDALVEELIDANPEKAAAFRNGKQQLLGFFMGQAMKKSGGKVNPQALRETLARKLGE